MTENTALVTTEKQHANIAEIDTDTADMFGRFWPEFMGLTNLQQVVLIRLVRNMGSEVVQSDAEIASDLGIHRHSIQYCRNHPVFTRLLGAISHDVVRGNVDRLIRAAMKASDDGKVSAIELMLEYSGEFIKSMRSQVVHTTDDFASIKTAGDLLGKVCRSLQRIGYTKERILAELEEVWTQLENDNAF